MLAHWIFTDEKIHLIHTYISSSLSGYEYVWMFFFNVNSAVRVLIFPEYLIRFLPVASLNQCVFVLCGIMSQTAHIYIPFCLTDISNQCMNNIMLVPACSSNFCESHSSLLNIHFFTFFVFPDSKYHYLNTYLVVLQIMLFYMRWVVAILFSRWFYMTTSYLFV